MVGLVARGTKHVGPQVRVSPSVVLSAAFGLFRTGCPSTVLDASVAPFAASFRDGECELLTRKEEASSFSPFRGPDAYGSLSLSKVRYQLIIRSRDSPCTRVLRVPSTMASTLSLVILQAIVLVVSSTDRETRVNESFHGRVSQIGTRKIIWPHLFRERWARVQEREHDWNRLWNYKNDDDVETTIATAPTIGSSMRPIVRSNATRPDKFGAIAVAEYAGTRAIAYAGFHEDHRHRALSEATTRGYQRILTTTPTYTRHHSGIAREQESIERFLSIVTQGTVTLRSSQEYSMKVREIDRESTGKITRNSRLPMVYKAYRGTLINQTRYYPEAMDTLLKIPS
uniref:Uncharacterized protein n=1 Tax=Vespula pensylvanica TaxID=30213 RepID=A0A834U4T8_VESPE|nr:hypothetical protein H0235_011415 [Vespula pensylvanica]